MTIEVPARIISVANEDLGIDAPEEGRVLLVAEHIIYIVEQPDTPETVLVVMIDGAEIQVLLSYSDVKALLE